VLTNSPSDIRTINKHQFVSTKFLLSPIANLLNVQGCSVFEISVKIGESGLQTQLVEK